MKRCSNCFFIKSDSEFYPNRTAKHPSNRLQSYCKQCKRETFRGWKKRKRELPPDEITKRNLIAEYGLLLFNKYHKGKK